jgi:hypothetical protein
MMMYFTDTPQLTPMPAQRQGGFKPVKTISRISKNIIRRTKTTATDTLNYTNKAYSAGMRNKPFFGTIGLGTAVLSLLVRTTEITNLCC